MAATRLIALHLNKGKTLAQCLAARVDYAQNPDKTEQGSLVSSYACDPRTAAEEFLLSKREYDQKNPKGKSFHGRDVIAYQIRQSFKPGEVSAEEANRIGYELAMSVTKGKYAFTVATHTDRAHIHNHILYNSTRIDGSGKYKDFWRSGLALQKTSDLICLQHGLSVIKPLPYHLRQKRTTYPRSVSFREQIRADMNRFLLRNPSGMDELLQMFKEAGYECKSGKHPAVRRGDQKRYIRFSSLGEDYSEEKLAAKMSGDGSSKDRKSQNHKKNRTDKPFDLLIDIQQKLRSGKGPGYERWATKFNIRQMAQVLLFLQENNIRDYDTLVMISDESSGNYRELSGQIRSLESRLTEITELKTQIIGYAKTREVYSEYRKHGYSKRFFEEHREELTIHKAAKEYFDQHDIRKLPKIKDLNQEYAKLLQQKKELYTQYRKAKEESRQLQLARRNVDTFLGLDRNESQKKEQVKEQ